MNRLNSTMAVALVCAGFGAGALAQDKPTTSQNADKTQVAPSKKDVQRSDARNTKPQRNTMAGNEVRDWKAIDKNHDNLISPEEMEAALKQPSSQGGKSSQTKP